MQGCQIRNSEAYCSRRRDRENHRLQRDLTIKVMPIGDQKSLLMFIDAFHCILKQYNNMCSVGNNRTPTICHQTSVFYMNVMYITKLRYPVKMKANGGLIVTKSVIL